MRHLSKNKANQILSLLDLGQSTRAIAAQTGVGHSTMQRVSASMGGDCIKSPGGCPHKLSSTTIHHAAHLITSGKVKTAKSATKLLRHTTSATFCATTLRRGLKGMGFKAKIKVKKPGLTVRHMRQCFAFATAHQDWTVEDWKKVVFTDETKLNRVEAKGREWVWVREGEKLSDRMVQKTQKYGGGHLMFWGCMSWEGVGNRAKIEPTMDADKYLTVLELALLSTMKMWKKTWKEKIFQQDNDSKHTSKKAKV